VFFTWYRSDGTRDKCVVFNAALTKIYLDRTGQIDETGNHTLRSNLHYSHVFCHLRRFLSSPEHPDRLCGPPSLLFNGHRGSFPGTKRPGRKINHILQSSGEVRI
jgi:hypothetical protein